MSSMYHQGSRQLQDRFDSQRIADRLEQRTVHKMFTDADRAFIERSPMFFLATADAEGHPDCSYKGGMPGFVRVMDSTTLAFPDYDGNGMFKSLGNTLVNPHVGMLFIDFEHPDRIRINGIATVHDDDPLLSEYPGAQLIIRVQAEHIFPNCPRYIHTMQITKYSVYAPPARLRPVRARVEANGRVSRCFTRSSKFKHQFSREWNRLSPSNFTNIWRCFIPGNPPKMS